jgi:hypothetical protein
MFRSHEGIQVKRNWRGRMNTSGFEVFRFRYEDAVTVVRIIVSASQGNATAWNQGLRFLETVQTGEHRSDQNCR